MGGPPVSNARFRSFAGGAVVLYWGALIGASLTNSMFWDLHLLWAYPLAGAPVWACLATHDRPDRVALWVLILGALLPPIVPVVVLRMPPPPVHHSEDGPGLGLLFTLAWCVAAVVQVLGMAVVAWSLQGLARLRARARAKR